MSGILADELWIVSSTADQQSCFHKRSKVWQVGEGGLLDCDVTLDNFVNTENSVLKYMNIIF